MVHLLCRATAVQNDSDHLIEMKEKQSDAPPGFYSKPIQFQPHAQKNIPATMFRDRVICSLRASTIVICVNGVEVRHLTPEYFISHSHITFTVDESNGKLHVRMLTVKPTGIIDELLRIRLLVT